MEYRLEEPDVGMSSGRSLTTDLPKERVRQARMLLPPNGSWSPWP